MPDRRRRLLEKYSPEQIRGAIERFTARDNTKTAFSSAGYVPAEERSVPDRSDVMIDDGPMGFVPVVGDVLQGGQAIIDAGEGKYGRAALGAGFLLVPNALEKPLKVGAKAVRQMVRNANIRSVDDLYKAAEKAVEFAKKRNGYLNSDYADYPEFAEFLKRTKMEPGQEAVDRFAEMQGRSVRGAVVPDKTAEKTTEEFMDFYNTLSPEEKKTWIYPQMREWMRAKNIPEREKIILEETFLTRSPYNEEVAELVSKYRKPTLGADSMGSRGIYSSNSLSVANDNANAGYLGDWHGVIGEIQSPIVYDRSLPLLDQLDQIGSNVFSYDDIIDGSLGTVYGMNDQISDAARKVGYGMGDHSYTNYKNREPIYERTTLGPESGAALIKKIEPWHDADWYKYGLREHPHMRQDKRYFIPKITTEKDLEQTADLLSWLTNSYGNPLFACGGKKYPDGGKFFRTNLRDESPLMYQPMMPVYPEVSVPERYYPQPNYGDYEYPVSTGMIQSMPIRVNVPVSASMTGVLADEVSVPVSDLFSDEAIARRALKQRYAESSFNDKAVSKAGAQGAWQIMPITLKDYLGRGRGKAGDLNDPEYNRKVRDWVMGIIPKDLQDLYSEDDAPLVRLAKIYGAYNWGAGNMRKYLRKKRDAGEDISNSVDWVEGLNPETRRYIKYLAFDEDIPDSTAYTNAAFEKAATAKGLFREGGKKKDRKDFNPSSLKKAIVDVVGPGYYPNLVDVHGDFSRFYWGRPQKKDMLIDSPYYPTKSNDPDAKYYRVNDAPFLNDLVHLYNSSISHDLKTHPVRPLLNVGDSAVLSGYDARNNSKRDSEYVGDTLERHLIRDGRAMGDKPIEGASVTNYPLTDSVGALGYFTVGRGNDERGDYLSYYDNWDLNGHTKITRAVEKYGLGKPYEIYDRIYGTFGENGEFHPLGEIEPSVISSEKASGGKIHIKPSKRGTFTAAAKKHGKSVQAFASQVLANKNRYSSAMVKKANFARNAARWHAEGGILERYDADSIRQAIQNARARQKK